MIWHGTVLLDIYYLCHIACQLSIFSTIFESLNMSPVTHSYGSCRAPILAPMRQLDGYERHVDCQHSSDQGEQVGHEHDRCLAHARELQVVMEGRHAEDANAMAIEALGELEHGNLKGGAGGRIGE